MWFTETPWPPIIGLCIVGVLLFLGWLSQRRTVFLAGIALCVALSGIVFVVEQQIVTEREQVEQRLMDFVVAFQRDSTQRGVINAFLVGPQPASFDYISASADDVRRLAVRAMNLADVSEDVRITDVHTTMTNQNSRAITQFRASATVAAAGYGNVGRQPTRWELTWQRENGDWKVIRVTRLHFLTGERLQEPLTARE